MIKPTLSDLETLARQAGEILRAGYISRPGSIQRTDISYKGAIDLVTEVDRRSEAFLIGEIQQRFPGDAIVAEESGGLAGRSSACWYIDPLDGTVNYAHGIPIFAVSIGYQDEAGLSLGAVYDPLQDELYLAGRGAGARLNGEPLQAASTQTLDHSLLVTGFPYNIRTTPENNLNHYTRFSLRSLGVRRLGSAALDLCYVAAGRFDGFWEVSLKPWDLAAGALIAAEAGARVTRTNGDPDFLQPPYDILAAAPAVHPQMLAVLRA